MKCVRGIFAAGMLGLVGSAEAHELLFRALLSGPNHPTPTSSTADGVSLIEMDLDIINMDVQTQFDGLSGNVSSAQIHGRTSVSLTGTAPAAIPLPAFLTGVTSGMDSELIDLQPAASYTQDFIHANGGNVGDALTALIFGFVQGRMYLSLDTTASPAGEIGGFFKIFPDSNDDGKIDSLDFSAVAAHFNTFGTDLHTGDFNIDGYTNALDFNAVASNYGESVSFDAARLASLVPEPASFVKLIFGATWMARRRAKVASRQVGGAQSV